MMREFLASAPVQALLAVHLPRYGELPALELYMDQVISVINQALQPLAVQASSSSLTSTMINNYVKQKLVPPPQRKRYTRDHVAYFISVALLKQVFSIAQIRQLLHRPAVQENPAAVYDRFCGELEQALHGAFGNRQLVPEALENPSADQELLRSVVLSLVNAIYTAKFLEYAAKDAP